MINENEIRVGNYIYMPNGDIGKVGYEVIRALIVLPEKPNYNPIPLTEDILVKCGFIYEENKGFEYVDDFGVKQIIKDDPYWYVNYNGKKRFIYHLNRKEAYVGIQCEFLHTLQNIFNLVSGGEELNIIL